MKRKKAPVEIAARACIGCTKEFARMSRHAMPEGQHVRAGTHEAAEMTLNRILDFFRAPTTPTTVIRPVPER
jgi:hypothetical protein